MVDDLLRAIKARIEADPNHREPVQPRHAVLLDTDAEAARTGSPRILTYPRHLFRKSGDPLLVLVVGSVAAGLVAVRELEARGECVVAYGRLAECVSETA